MNPFNILLAILLSTCLTCNLQTNEVQSTTNTSLEINDGIRKAYHNNGQLKNEGNYVAGKKEGLHRVWQSNGILELEGFYSNGLANGRMKWYHEKGHLAAEGNMKDGIRNGPWKICDVEENGFCIAAHFKDGKRHGVWKINHDSGTLWKEQTWENDKVVSEKCWDKKGVAIECTRI